MNVGIIMDSLNQIKPQKDSTVLAMLEAKARGHSLFYMQLNDLFCENTYVSANMRAIRVDESCTPWFSLESPETRHLNTLDVILMRKDPPFDMEYLYATYLLELAENQGAFVINNPKALRNANEKLFTQWFPNLIPPTLITSNKAKLVSFIEAQQDVVLKPLNEMGGRSIFHLKKNDDNQSVIIDSLTKNQKCSIMAQRFIPDILESGDKRITLMAGEPASHALARIPAKGDFRGNLAAGGTGISTPLTPREREICSILKPKLIEKGLIWVGIDVIGGYLTEINVTSPTGLRELDAQIEINLCQPLWDWIEQQHKKPRLGQRT